MVLRLGVNEWPMPGRIVSKATYDREYHELTAKRGVPFVPDAAWKDAVFAAAIILAVMACALFFGPFGPSGQPDPTIIQTAPKPDFAFLWIYAVLAYLPPQPRDAIHLYCADGRHWRDAAAAAGGRGRREALVAAAGSGADAFAVIAVTLGVFTQLGTYTPWSPIMDGVVRRCDARLVSREDRSPLERQGALVLQNKQCRNCHSLGGRRRACAGRRSTPLPRG